MGYDWPLGSDAHDRFLKRLFKLREEIQEISLAEFTVGDLESLYRVTPRRPKNALDDPREEDLERLEKRVLEIKAKLTN